MQGFGNLRVSLVLTTLTSALRNPGVGQRPCLLRGHWFSPRTASRLCGPNIQGPRAKPPLCPRPWTSRRCVALNTAGDISLIPGAL